MARRGPFFVMWFVGKPVLDLSGHLGEGPEKKSANELICGCTRCKRRAVLFTVFVRMLITLSSKHAANNGRKNKFIVQIKPNFDSILSLFQPPNASLSRSHVNTRLHNVETFHG